ncbi:lantibiotic dehydratase [Nocardiopsis dassonvillei]|uniref:lantibiotic dehydratase n=1 Tax=Nocardiopsis dassonvillei TaxID=2014 RepID=UPI0033F8C533
MARRSSVSYRWRGGALLRATTDPGGLDLPRDLDPEDGSIARSRSWLAAVWGREHVRDAMRTASPALCSQIEDVLAGDCSEPRRVRSTVRSLATYLLRWQQRPTPFGSFAGLAPVATGGSGRVRWGHDHRRVIRADAEWLTEVITRLERCSELRRRLRLITNNTGTVRGTRFVAQGAPADGHAHLAAPIEVSVSRTRPVAAALEAARAPVPYGHVRARLLDDFPEASPDRIDELLGGLIAQNLLITSLWAPTTHTDALEYLCGELRALRAHTIAETTDLVQELYTLRDRIAAQPATGPWAGQEDLSERMLALTPDADVPVPFMVDTALDCDVRIPERVIREAQEAAGVLYRLTAHPYGARHWSDYHHRFRSHYGPGAVVPILELVADSGLGYPATYLGSGRHRTAPHRQERDDVLLALLQQAQTKGHREIVLNREAVDALSVEEGAEFAPRIELSVQIYASSVQDLEHGDFRLAVTGVPRPCSSMAGRFAHLLTEQERGELARTYREELPQNTIAAQLSFPPRRRRNANITRTPRLLEHMISLAEHQPAEDGVIPLEDLAVTADARRFHLLRISTGQRVEPHVPHALEAGSQTPPLARFISEIATARCAVYGPFDFGAATRMPYLPRVRYHRTILSPARWLLDAAHLPERRARAQEWDEAFDTWRNRWHVPDCVTMVEHDQRLTLDLTHPLHRYLLRTRLRSTSHLELREAPDPQDFGWLGRAHELLLPLTLTRSSTPDPPLPRARPLRAFSSEAAHQPGRAPILHAQVHTHPERIDEILTGHLPELFDGAGPMGWWFERHHDLTHPEADPYLSLFVHLADEDDYGAVAAHLNGWTTELHAQRLVFRSVLTTHRPQTGRYGDGQAMDAACEVFAADSAAALAQIRAAATKAMDAWALTAVSMVDLVTAFTETSEQGHGWLVAHSPGEAQVVGREVRQEALRLADPDKDYALLRSLPGGGEVVAAWQARATALAAYRKHLTADRDPLTVLRSLLHLHHRRTLGVDPGREAAIGRLARAIALSHNARSSR